MHSRTLEPTGRRGLSVIRNEIDSSSANTSDLRSLFARSTWNFSADRAAFVVETTPSVGYVMTIFAPSPGVMMLSWPKMAVPSLL